MLDPLPLSLLNDYLFCHRRAALKIVEGLRRANVHTLIGDLAHEHADLPGYEIAKGVTLLRALPVWSDRVGLSGKCDIVEQHPGGALVPVEYKKGKRRHFDNDDVQLCAQALCLEEMFARPVKRGAVFHAASKRRREVEFTAELRALTEQTAAEVHALAGGSQGESPIANSKSQIPGAGSQILGFKSQIPPVPPAVLKPQCAECSLYEVCLPRITSLPERVNRAVAALFEV